MDGSAPDIADTRVPPLEVRVPQLVPPGPNAREHWSARHRRVSRERRDVALALAGPPMRFECKLVVTLTRCSPRFLDDDNAVGAMKAARDQVADFLGLKNDRDPRVTWRVEQRKCKRAEAGTVIRIEGV